MKQHQAWALSVALLLNVPASLLAPWPIAAAIATLALLASRQIRGQTIFLSIGILSNLIFLGLWLPSGPQLLTIGPASISSGGLLLTASVTARGAALILVPWTLLERVGIPQWLDGMRLPPKLLGPMAALWLTASDAASDGARIARLERINGGRPTLRQTLPRWLQESIRRAQVRRNALQAVGHATGRYFVPVVAFSALAIAGRMATIALPNLAPTYLLVFIAGWWGGWRVGALVGLISMAASDVMISGFALTGMVNVPAMALVGVLGAWASKVEVKGKVAEVAMLASFGVFATLAFSVAADTLDWLILVELRSTPGAWQLRVIQGLTFNVVAAIVNGVLFATTVVPVSHSLRASER